jgi:2-succinyl-5-enolpyruvyl-6-hydroxy-3-cyclohexene-1-carboxylate synthase
VRDDRPAAVVTTSGTAAAELLPAMVEAYYSSAKLLAITADRPQSYRGTGAPQSIEQANLFGVYARQAFDLPEAADDWRIDPCCWPVHVNVPFDEPLLAGWQHELKPSLESLGGASPRTLLDAGADSRLSAAVGSMARPLIIVGALRHEDDRQDVADFCEGVGGPIVAEASSHLRRRLSRRLLRAGETTASKGLALGLFDGVLRIGEIPSFSLWRELERHHELSLVSVSRRPWRGLTRGLHFEVPPDSRLPLRGLGVRSEFSSGGLSKLMEEDARIAGARERLLRRYPLSEPALIRNLSCTIPEGSFVYLGNSLPIREWNDFASLESRDFEHGENRGANGIDGQLSTFLGAARPGRENWAVVGDLTTLYDLQSLWALPRLEVALRIVVINNGGGRIFRRMFENPRFQNAHPVEFDMWARMFDASYSTDPSLLPSGGTAVIELRPDLEQTDKFWGAMRAAREG